MRYFVVLYSAIVSANVHAAPQQDWYVDVVTRSYSTGGESISFVGGRTGLLHHDGFSVGVGLYVPTESDLRGSGQYYDFTEYYVVGGVQLDYRRDITDCLSVDAGALLGGGFARRTTRDYDLIRYSDGIRLLVEPGVGVSVRTFAPVWLRAGVSYPIDGDPGGFDDRPAYELGLRFSW